MARSAIGTVQFRAKDLEIDDICQLKLHGVNRWVRITDVTKQSDDSVLVTYKGLIGERGKELTEYELVRTQVEKEPA